MALIPPLFPPTFSPAVPVAVAAVLVAAGAAFVVVGFGTSVVVVAVGSGAAAAGDEGFRSMDFASEIWVGAGMWWVESPVVAVGSVVVVAVGEEDRQKLIGCHMGSHRISKRCMPEGLAEDC